MALEQNEDTRGIKSRHEKNPFRMVKAAHPQTGYIQEVKVDSHSPLREDEFRVLGWLLVDDYKTPEQKAWLEAECKKRRDAHEAADRASLLRSPRGREAVIHSEIAKDAARAAVAAVTVVTLEEKPTAPSGKAK